jgi:hypothetical protein
MGGINADRVCEVFTSQVFDRGGTSAGRENKAQNEEACRLVHANFAGANFVYADRLLEKNDESKAIE